jgi:zinc protease
MNSQRPQPGVPREYAFPEVHRATLTNGLRVAVAHMPRLPLVTVLALVDAGATRDAAGTEGEALLTARALGEGTRHLSGADLTERFEQLGTGLDTACGWDDATASITVTPERLEPAVALLADVLTSPAFDEREVERLRSERLAELLQLQVEPRGLADDKFAEFLYSRDSRYSIPEGGNRASVSGLDRQSLRVFHAANYVPAKTTLIFAGDVKASEAVRLVERSLSDWRRAAAATATATPGDQAASLAARIELVHKPGAPQTELRVGNRGVPRSHPDYFPIVVMNALLGGLFASRINLNLRERNAYTYGARSTFEWRRAAGPFVVSTAVKTEVTAAATREILLEIRRLRDETVSSEELSLATAYLDGVFPIRYETTEAVAGAVAAAVVYELGNDYYTRYRALVRSVSAGDVRRAAERFLQPDSALIVAVGDASVIRDSLEGLGIGPVNVHEPENGVGE